MKTALLYLTLSATFTGLLWLPCVVDRLRVRGVAGTLGYPERPPPPSAWAARLQRAHANAVENLAVFATLVLVAEAAGVADAAVGTAAVVYFWSRVVHALAYAFAVPGLRTLAFGIGFAAQAAVAWRLLAPA
jgi:uncharacterized membrane protein YecN with MAPEG domain